MSDSERTRASLEQEVWFCARNPRVIEAFRAVDRRCFAPPGLRSLSYEDTTIQIAEGYSISQPTLLVEMIDHLRLTGQENVLEIGAGSGYVAAILGKLARSVHTVEYNPRIVLRAQKNLEKTGSSNVSVYVGDGLHGLPDRTPFDAILVSAAAREIPQVFINQLSAGGRLVIPVGKDPHHQSLMVGYVGSDGEFYKQEQGRVQFHPLISIQQGGWTKELMEKAYQLKKAYLMEQIDKIAEEKKEDRFTCLKNMAIDNGMPKDQEITLEELEEACVHGTRFPDNFYTQMESEASCENSPKD